MKAVPSRAAAASHSRRIIEQCRYVVVFKESSVGRSGSHEAVFPKRSSGQQALGALASEEPGKKGVVSSRIFDVLLFYEYLRQAFPQGVHFGVRKRFAKLTMIGLNDLIDGRGVDAFLLELALSLVRVVEVATVVVRALDLGGSKEAFEGRQQVLGEESASFLGRGQVLRLQARPLPNHLYRQCGPKNALGIVYLLEVGHELATE